MYSMLVLCQTCSKVLLSCGYVAVLKPRLDRTLGIFMTGDLGRLLQSSLLNAYPGLSL